MKVVLRTRLWTKPEPIRTDFGLNVHNCVGHD